MFTNKTTLAAAALIGLLGAGVMTVNAYAADGAMQAQASDQSSIEKHACKGQNSCKGKGWVEMTQAECDKAKVSMKK